MTKFDGFELQDSQGSAEHGNKLLVITGTGDSFIDEIDGPSLGQIFKPAAWGNRPLRGRPNRRDLGRGRRPLADATARRDSRRRP